MKESALLTNIKEKIKKKITPKQKSLKTIKEKAQNHQNSATLIIIIAISSLKYGYIPLKLYF